MNKEQLYKILKVVLITTIIMFIFELAFSFNVVTDFFKGLITSSSGWVAYLVIWAIMFLQCSVLNIPAYVILSASVSIGIKTLSLAYFATVITAYMAGCLLSYAIGRKWGIKAVKWCAGSEEDFNKWSEVLNNKGKWWYFLTVLLPLFPDDLLCIVAGSVKFKFGLYTIFNFIGRSIGLLTMCAVLEFIGMKSSDFPFMLIVWGVAIVAEIIAILIVKRKK